MSRIVGAEASPGGSDVRVGAAGDSAAAGGAALIAVDSGALMNGVGFHIFSPSPEHAAAMHMDAAKI
jgi:hypothetical protein